MWAELRLLLALGIAIWIPGWTLLALSESWRDWPGLQRWIVAAGLGIVFYPLLFYGLRLLLPRAALGPYTLGALLLAGAVFTGWRLRRHWRELLRFTPLEWAALGVFGLTLGTRLWIAHRYPFPAQTDSLHHVLLTQLTAEQGRLPATLAPYFPVPLDMYHMGLHSLSAAVLWLAQVPAHSALLWTAQFLNGLAGLGVFLVLDRKGYRLGGLAAAVAVGLWSHMPAFYVNWGRFTQVSSQTVLLIAWLVTHTAVVQGPRLWQRRRGMALWSGALAAMLTAGVFLLHFRVAAFYLPLLALSLGSLLWQQRHDRAALGHTLLWTAAIGAGALLLVIPVLVPALATYMASNRSLATQTVVSQAQLAEVMEGYYEFPWSSIPVLAARPWLLALSTLALVIGLLRGNRLTWLAAGWLVLLLAVGNTYWLGIPMLNVTNLGAVLIMLYLPFGLLIGAGAQELATWLPQGHRTWGTLALAVLVLASGVIGAAQRVREVVPENQFITDADLKAMAWINANLPPDAVFAVNTFNWLGTTPGGTDAGYWLPYFTHRGMTAAVLLVSLGGHAYHSQVLETADLVTQLEGDPAQIAGAVDALLSRDVHYVYIGANGSFSPPILQTDSLLQSGRAVLLYEDGPVAILELK
jgi:hypothetical protein